MGRCSELPSENQSGGPEIADPMSSLEKQKRRTSAAASYYQNRQQQRDDGDHSMAEPSEHLSSDSKTPLMEKNTNGTNNFFLNVRQGANNGYEPNASSTRPRVNSGFSQSQNHNYNDANYREKQYERSPNPRRTNLQDQSSSFSTPVRNQISTEQINPEPIAQPPESAKRIRCYRLNLDSDDDPSLLHQTGPVESRNVQLQMSVSEDSSVAGKTNVAASTAQIFRGLTIARDGTVQSKKMGRSSRSSANGKTDAKSRQAAKIDKAKDLVEESANGHTGEKEDDSKMISLVIMGEYNDMKNLVRDGSKRLKDSEGLPDEALLSLNAKRFNASPLPLMSPSSQSRVDNRKRSPLSGGYSPVKMKAKSPQSRKSFTTGGSMVSNTSSPMPRLKENPRDTRPLNNRGGYSSSKHSSRRFSSEKCTNIPIFSGGGDSDWFNSIWSCGTANGKTGTISPNGTNYHHQQQNYKHQSGRTPYFSESATERRDEAPLGHRMEVPSRGWDK